MLYTKIKPQSFLGSGQEGFKCSNHIWVWGPSCLMVQNHINELAIPFWQEIWSRQKKKAIYQHSMTLYDLEKGVKVFKIKSVLVHVPLIYVCKFGHNPSILSGYRVQTSHFSTFFDFVWPWKWGHGHQNLISSCPCPVNIRVQVWSKSIHSFRIQGADKPFFNILWPWKWSQGHQNLTLVHVLTMYLWKFSQIPSIP